MCVTDKLAPWKDLLEKFRPKTKRLLVEGELLSLLDPTVTGDIRKSIEMSLVKKGFPRSQLPPAPPPVKRFKTPTARAKSFPPQELKKVATRLKKGNYSIPRFQRKSYSAFMVPQKYAGSIVLTYFRSLRLMGTVGLAGGACVGLAFWYGNAGIVAHLDSDSQGHIATVVPTLLEEFGKQMREPEKKHSLKAAEIKDRKAWIIFPGASKILPYLEDYWKDDIDKVQSSGMILRELMELSVKQPKAFPPDLRLVDAGDFLLDVNTGKLQGGLTGSLKEAKFSFGDYSRFYRCPPGGPAMPIDNTIVKELESENVKVPLGWQKWQKMMGPCHPI